MTSISKVFSGFLGKLTPRQREVIVGRFGLDKSGAVETLAAIGERLSVTRERVRQIENSALGMIKEEVLKSRECREIVGLAKKTLKHAGGVMEKDTFLKNLSELAPGVGENHISLLIESSREFHFYPEDEEHQAFYYLTKSDLQVVLNFIANWTYALAADKNKILSGYYKEHLQEFIKKKHLDEEHVENFLAITKIIHENNYGDKGLRSWPEIHPQTARDRAYLILKKKNEPMHFVAIADAINDAKLSLQETLAPTVHNELIKDNRFVLVGRGIYALREHGYEPGIAREVIQRILKNEGPMKSGDLVARVTKERLFKPNTIIINLQNKDYFERTSDGRYRLRES